MLAENVNFTLAQVLRTEKPKIQKGRSIVLRDNGGHVYTDLLNWPILLEGAVPEICDF